MFGLWLIALVTCVVLMVAISLVAPRGGNRDHQPNETTESLDADAKTHRKAA